MYIHECNACVYTYVHYTYKTHEMHISEHTPHTAMTENCFCSGLCAHVCLSNDNYRIIIHSHTAHNYLHSFLYTVCVYTVCAGVHVCLEAKGKWVPPLWKSVWWHDDLFIINSLSPLPFNPNKACVGVGGWGTSSFTKCHVATRVLFLTIQCWFSCVEIIIYSVIIIISLSLFFSFSYLCVSTSWWCRWIFLFKVRDLCRHNNHNDT